MINEGRPIEPLREGVDGVRQEPGIFGRHFSLSREGGFCYVGFRLPTLQVGSGESGDFGASLNEPRTAAFPEQVARVSLARTSAQRIP